MLEPKMSMEAWKALARATIGRHDSRGQGILVAGRRSRQHISGVVCFQSERDFVVGRVLAANRLIVIDIHQFCS
jgi:myo-inositol catabolism protein IolC